MIRRMFQGILTFVLVLGAHSSFLASEAKTQIDVYTEILYPLSYQDDNSEKFKGYATDILREAMAVAELDYTIHFHSWARSYETVTHTPNTLLYSVARIPEREDDFIWLQKISALNYGLYTSVKEKTSMSMEEVKQVDITVTQGGVSHKTLLNLGFENFVFIDDFSRLSQLVDRERITVIFLSSLWYEFNKHEFSKPLYKLDTIDISASDIDLYFAMNKDSSPATVNKLRGAFNKLMGDADSIPMPKDKLTTQ